MAVRAEYKDVVGKPPASRNKNRIDLMRKKIEKYKAKPKPPEPKPPILANTPKPKIGERKRPGPALEPAPKDSPDLHFSPRFPNPGCTRGPCPY